MPRLQDKLQVEIQGENRATLNNFTSAQITNDMTMPSEAALELGNDGTWAEIEDRIRPGTEYCVFVNDLLRLTGRVEIDDLPLDADGGSVVRFTIRTKLSDAMYTSADPGTRVKNTTIKKFILALYRPLGYTESDFEFDQRVSRDLLTGKSSKQSKKENRKTGEQIEKMTAQQAKVQPPESIYDAADRHLRRHGLMHWDSPDGKIVIGSPDDEQDPIYKLFANRYDNPDRNNIIAATKAIDYTGIPSTVTVFGRSIGRGSARKRIQELVNDSDVLGANFHRPIIIIAEGLRTPDLARTAAQREMSARSKRKDCWDIELDGLSHWTGSQIIPWGIDTTCQIFSDVAGGDEGIYYIHKVTLRRDAQSGDTTNLSVLKRGIWRLS